MPSVSIKLPLLRDTTLPFSMRAEVDDRVIYDPRPRAQKRRPASFIPRDERCVKAFALGVTSFARLFALNRTIAATMGESTNHTVNRSSALLDERSTNRALPGGGDIRGDKAAMRKREKETVNVCAHVCKKNKRGQRGGRDETTRMRCG